MHSCVAMPFPLAFPTMTATKEVSSPRRDLNDGTLSTSSRVSGVLRITANSRPKHLP